MARYIPSTLEALKAGDISSSDACYSLIAHLASEDIPETMPAPSDRDLKPFVQTVIQGVLDGNLSVLTATRHLISIKERLAAGMPINELLKTKLFAEKQKSFRQTHALN